MINENNDWDQDSNQEVNPIPQLVVNTAPIINTTSSFTYDGPMASGSFVSWSNTVTIGEDTSLDGRRVSINTGEVAVHPRLVITGSLLSPVSFDFSRCSWKYMLAYTMSLLFGPWLIIWSKIMGRPAGFRVRV